MSEKIFVGYEYKSITIKDSFKGMYLDAYENLGWVLEATSSSTVSLGCTILKFKRNRKIRNKAELTRLERQFNQQANEMLGLEKAKTLVPSIVAYIIGIIGTCFMTGSVFTVVNDLVVLSIVLAIPAFIGWITPYFIFKALNRKKQNKLVPLIDDKYEEIYRTCELASGLTVQKN